MGFFNYHLADFEVQVKIGNWVVRRIPYANIDGVRAGYAWWNEHWTNLLPFQYVTIRRKSGLFRNFVINPPDRGSFIAELQSRLKS